MSIDNARLLNFDTGIERIIRTNREATATKLPENSSLGPSGQALRVRLDEFLNTPSLDQKLRSTLQPTIKDKALLVPERYYSLLDQAQARLQTYAQNNKDPILGRTAELLNAEQRLRAMLGNFRSLLIKA
jgi:hypothetical protein